MKQVATESTQKFRKKPDDAMKLKEFDGKSTDLKMEEREERIKEKREKERKERKRKEGN